MLNKLSISVASCIVLVVTMGFSASAMAVPKADPYCLTHGNPVEILDFSFDTPDTYGAYQPSGIASTSYLCGAIINDFGIGSDTLYNHVEIRMPRTVRIADSDLVPNGSWAGTVVESILYHDGGKAKFRARVEFDVRTDDKAQCERERTEEIVGRAPRGPIVSCWRSESPLGQGWNWSVRHQRTGKLSLTIGPIHLLSDTRYTPGLTYIDLNLCGYYGHVGQKRCGRKGDQWQQKNGCNTRRYKIRATRQDGTVTPTARDTVDWMTLLESFARPFQLTPGPRRGQCKWFAANPVATPR